MTAKVYILLNILPWDGTLQVTQDVRVYTRKLDAVDAFKNETNLWDSYGFRISKTWSDESKDSGESSYMESEGIILQTQFKRDGMIGYLVLRENIVTL